MSRTDPPIETDCPAQTASGAAALGPPPGDIGSLPGLLGCTVRNAQGRHGATAIRLLQGVLADMGLPVAADGLTGPQTHEAANAAWLSGPQHLVDCYGLALRAHLYRAASADPVLRPMVAGHDGGKGPWIREAEASISPSYRLSTAEHADRIASWP